MAARLTLLTSSPRVPVGLLSREAWRALDAAEVVLAADHDQALVAMLTDHGIDVTISVAGSMSERARELVEVAGERDALWVGSTDDEPGLREAIAAETARLRKAPEVTAIVGSWDPEGGQLLEAVSVMDRLRAPAGCAWVAAQDHASLTPFVLEEAQEVHEALTALAADPDDQGTREHLVDELGDLLFQVLFHARVAADDARAPFAIDDVAAALVDKLIRRNPHVFGDAQAHTLEEIEAQWQAIKATERRP